MSGEEGAVFQVWDVTRVNGEAPVPPQDAVCAGLLSQRIPGEHDQTPALSLRSLGEGKQAPTSEATGWNEFHLDLKGQGTSVDIWVSPF